ncbi:MAG: hypothetical protein JWM81_1168 [Candidatus Saccharibacteria bacterium]|nr:hypothetical protein [Candidatus Saccharibacteria bacterium]
MQESQYGTPLLQLEGFEVGVLRTIAWEYMSRTKDSTHIAEAEHLGDLASAAFQSVRSEDDNSPGKAELVLTGPDLVSALQHVFWYVEAALDTDGKCAALDGPTPRKATIDLYLSTKEWIERVHPELETVEALPNIPPQRPRSRPNAFKRIFYRLFK